MVLALEDHRLWVSTILMSGIMQFPINIGGVLTTRMWIYTCVSWVMPWDHVQKAWENTLRMFNFVVKVVEPRVPFLVFVLLASTMLLVFPFL